jgi:hypothetical protein
MQTSDEYLPLLTSQSWWDETLKGLEKLFRIDLDFKPEVFACQKALVR